MGNYVSQREFAKHIDRSHVWVNRLVKEGRLPADDKGRIPLEAGLEAYAASHTVGTSPAVRAAPKRAGRAAGNKGKTSTPVDDLPGDLPDPGSLNSVVGLNEAYNRARTAEKTYQAKLRELEYKEASGELIPAADVKADAQKTGAEVRERLMSMPPRLAGLCEGRTAREIERIITEGINEALEALQNSRFRKGK